MLRVRSDEIASSVIDGDATIINMATRIYYALDGVGAEIWERLLSGSSEERLFQELRTKYAISPEVLREDLGRLLAELQAEALIEDLDSDPEAERFDVSALPGVAALPYCAPFLQRFDDMQRELALDPPMPIHHKSIDW